MLYDSVLGRYCVTSYIIYDDYLNWKIPKQKKQKNIKDVHRFGKAFGRLEAMLGNLKEFTCPQPHSLVLLSYLLSIYLKKNISSENGV